ncbi:MAG: SRPBCC family protein [Actinomycetota bacterium]
MAQPIKVERTVTIEKSVEDLYRFWHTLESLPRFTRHLKSVKVYDDGRSHWVTSAPMGNSVEWDARITEDRPNQVIAWTSEEGADIANSGSVHFQPAPGGRGTEVKVITTYDAPAGVVGDAIAKLFGENPKQQIGDDLARFKMLMETGEIATNEGQTSGRRS